MAVALLAFGLPGATRPERVATLYEQVDAIGSTRSASEVAPADWNVRLTRYVGLLFAGGGAVGLVVCLA